MSPIILSHRGLIEGPDSNLDNNPKYIKQLLSKGVFVEVDVWYLNDQYYLGHDFGKYKIEESFLMHPSLYCHAKHFDSFYKMLQNHRIHCFYHTDEDFVLTSHFRIWQANYNNLSPLTIVVDTTKNPDYNAKCYGICCDYYPI